MRTDDLDVTASHLTAIQPPENNLDFKSYDIYRKLTQKEKRAMQQKIQDDTVKFAAALDEEMLPTMPHTKKSTVLGKRSFLGIVAARQARLQAQIDWLHTEQEKHKQEDDL